MLSPAEPRSLQASRPSCSFSPRATQLLTLGIFQSPGVPFSLTPSEFPPLVPVLVLLLPGCRAVGQVTGDSGRKHRCPGAGTRGRAQGATELLELP